MKWVVFGAGVLLFLFVLRRLIAGLSYGKIFAPAHLAELARKVHKARSAALDAVVSGEKEDEDPKLALERGAAFVTSQGIGLMYTIAEKSDAWEHHLSMSFRGGALARSAAATLLVFIRRVLGFTGATTSAEEAGSGVIHFVARMTPEQHDAYAKEEPELPDEAASARMFADVVRSEERTALLASLSR
jgi:hypothetical protein